MLAYRAPPRAASRSVAIPRSTRKLPPLLRPELRGPARRRAIVTAATDAPPSAATAANLPAHVLSLSLSTCPARSVHPWRAARTRTVSRCRASSTPGSAMNTVSNTPSVWRISVRRAGVIAGGAG